MNMDHINKAAFEAAQARENQLDEEHRAAMLDLREILMKKGAKEIAEMDGAFLANKLVRLNGRESALQQAAETTNRLSAAINSAKQAALITNKTPTVDLKLEHECAAWSEAWRILASK